MDLYCCIFVASQAFLLSIEFNAYVLEASGWELGTGIFQRIELPN